MNLKYVQGFIEFYSVDQYELIEQCVNSLGDHNFFNIVLDRKFAINHGSIIIPFARSFRSDGDDELFLNQCLNELVATFGNIDSFAIDVVFDRSESKYFRLSAVFDGSYCSIVYMEPSDVQFQTRTLDVDRKEIKIDFFS